jgi:hypothetical protein
MRRRNFLGMLAALVAAPLLKPTTRLFHRNAFSMMWPKVENPRPLPIEFNETGFVLHWNEIDFNRDTTKYYVSVPDSDDCASCVKEQSPV